MPEYNLISSGTHLWKHNSHLLRTPLYKSIQIAPDEMAYYDVAGSYSSAMPTAGVISTSESNIYLNTVKSGKTMRGYYLGQNKPDNQIWRRVTTGHEPEFVFYHGAFSPSANSIPSGMNYGEAFMKIPAYHFTIPREYASMRPVSGAITLTHGGCIHSYGFPSIGQSSSRRDGTGQAFYTSLCPTSRLVRDDEWRTNWPQKLGVYDSLDNSISTMHGGYTEEVELDTCKSLGGGLVDDLYSYSSGTGNYTKVVGKRLIWSNTYTNYYDGNIPVSPHPWVQQITLGSSSIGKIALFGGGWIVITPDVAKSSSSTDSTKSDYPFYYPSSSTGQAWWICCSYWGFGLKLTMEM